MGNEREWYQQNVDRLLQPELWATPPSHEEDKEKTVSERLEKVATDFFKKRTASHHATGSGKKPSEDPFSEFIKLGEKNAWIDSEKIDRLHSLAESTGLIPPEEAIPGPSTHHPSFGKVIDDAYRKSHARHATETSVAHVQDYYSYPPAEEVKPVVASSAEKKADTYNTLASYGQWVFESVTLPFVYTLRKKPVDPVKLQQAFEKRNLQTLVELISKGADINSVDKEGRTPLHLAVMARNDEIVQKLLSLKADVNKQDLSGETPLHKAASHHASKSCVHCLLKARAKIDIPDKNGNTALSLAAMNNHTACVEQLCHAGAVVNHKNLQGNTPLLEAAAYGSVIAVEFLLKHGADPAIENLEGFNSVSRAKAVRPEKHKEIVRLLEDHSPQVALSSKKVLKERFLGHVSEIDDAAEVKRLGDLSTVGKGTEKGAGFLPQYSFSKIRKSLREYSIEFPQALTPGMSGMIRMATESNCAIGQVPMDLYERWKTGKPIVINAGYSGHYVSVTIWKDKLVICNRGEGATFEGPKIKTMKVFTFDKSKLTADIINDLLHSNQHDLTFYKKFVHEVLPDLLGLSHSPIDELLEAAALPKQKIGNCAYANAEGAVLALMLLSKLFQIPPDSGPFIKQKVEQIVIEQKAVFTNWQAYLLLRSMEKDLKWVKDPRNHLVPNFDLVKGAFARFAAIHSLPPELKASGDKLKQEWDAVEKRILSPTRLDKAYYYFGVPTLLARVQRRKK